jgi:hypothetical protein
MKTKRWLVYTIWGIWDIQNLLLTVFIRRWRADWFVTSVVYVDDIYLIGDHTKKINWTGANIQVKMQDLSVIYHSLECLEYFYIKEGTIMTWGMCTTWILEECGMVECNPTKTPMHVGLYLIADIGTPLTNIANHQHLVGKLTFYNLVAWPDQGEL